MASSRNSFFEGIFISVDSSDSEFEEQNYQFLGILKVSNQCQSFASGLYLMKFYKTS